MILFGALADHLGFLIEIVPEIFPGCEAKRQIGPGRWEHNWPECSLEVLELMTAVAVLASTAPGEPDARRSRLARNVIEN